MSPVGGRVRIEYLENCILEEPDRKLLVKGRMRWELKAEAPDEGSVVGNRIARLAVTALQGEELPQYNNQLQSLVGCTSPASLVLPFLPYFFLSFLPNSFPSVMGGLFFC